MSSRLPLTLAAILVVATFLAAAGSTTRATASPPEQGSVISAQTAPVMHETLYLTDEQVARFNASAPARPAQLANIVRRLSESFEDNPFPRRGSPWVISDACTSLPGQNDVIAWGREAAEMTVGGAGLWSVGGGSLGKGLDPVAKQYPSSRTGIQNCQGIRTNLVRSPIDFGNVSHGMRLTFDYKSKMPQDALFIGVGDLDKPNPDGGYDLTGFRNFKTDTGGDWERGVHVELNAAANVKKVILGIVYADPPPQGAGPMSTGVYGVFIDNIHIDAKFAEPAPYIPSPTATETATEPATRTPTLTRTPRPIFPTDTPTATRPTPTPGVPRFYMPLAMKAHGRPQFTAPPTVPSPTITLTPSPTPTATTAPTNTVPPTETDVIPPTDTPVPTPVPTRTPVPMPDVKIVQIMYQYVGSPAQELEVVLLKNLGTAPQDLTGWRVAEEYNTATCRIPAGVVLEPEGEYEIRSGKDAEPGVVNGIPGVICLALTGQQRPIWNNDRDKGTLYNDNNDAVDCLGYDKKTGLYRCL